MRNWSQIKNSFEVGQLWKRIDANGNVTSPVRRIKKIQSKSICFEIINENGVVVQNESWLDFPKSVNLIETTEKGFKFYYPFYGEKGLDYNKRSELSSEFEFLYCQNKI